MRFDIFGNRNKPVIIMLPGSFCPAESMKNLYDKLCSDFYVIAVTYNGHYEGSKDFTSRQGEAAEILQYLNDCGIGEIKMIYGQSMGAEIGIEILRQLSDNGISVQKAFFDGAPCIKMTRISKAFMLIKFRSLVQMVRTKPIDAIVKIPLVKKFANGDTEALRPLLIDMKAVSPCLTNKKHKKRKRMLLFL